MFERFTERARHVMVLAQEQSRLLDHDHIGTEHVLLGVVCEGQGAAATVLERHGLTVGALRQELAPGTTYGESAVPFTPGAKRVLERALQGALSLNHSDIEPEHLLLALTDDIPDDAPGGGAGALFGAAGVDPAVLHVELLGMLPKDAGRRRRLLPGRVEPLRPVRVPRARQTGAGEATPGPVCPGCRTALAGQLRFATVDAQPEEGTEATEVRQVVVAYCGSCGAALGTFAP